MTAQSRYWQVFGQIRRDAFYISACSGRVETIDRAIKVALAISSSAAIGGWAIWKDYAFIWGAVIAASQVLTAVKPFLPFKARLASLATLGPELDALAITAEADWFKVSRGQLTEQQTHDLTMNLLRKTKASATKSFKATSLPTNNRLLNRARNEATAYMAHFLEQNDDEAAN